jgi:hypothetical protein
MKRLSFTVCLVFLVLGNSSEAYTSCLVPDVTRGFEHAKAVFVGEVEEISPPRTTSKDAPFLDRAYVIQFKIERSWKGLPFGYLKVWALQGEYTLALPPFKKGERYLVYADPVLGAEVANDELKVDECNRTALLPRDAKQRDVVTDFEFNRENGAKDLRTLDSLILIPPKKRLIR